MFFFFPLFFSWGGGGVYVFRIRPLSKEVSSVGSRARREFPSRGKNVHESNTKEKTRLGKASRIRSQDEQKTKIEPTDQKKKYERKRTRRDIAITRTQTNTKTIPEEETKNRKPLSGSHSWSIEHRGQTQSILIKIAEIQQRDRRRDSSNSSEIHTPAMAVESL